MADSGTIAAWAALAAALLALVVALAQAAQQYAATAQDMKKCERSVWGPMPGYTGRRVFLWRQIRFRIVFDVPNIFIPTEYWERRGNARQFPSHRIRDLPAPFDPPSVNTDTESAIHNHSEACWVAFARQVSHVCPSAVRVGLMAGDADRLPADIPVVPMQVSLRDIIALGLMIGMNIQEASKDYIEMSGPFGFIKSSSHPILGSLIHFSAFSTTPHIKGLKTGDISKSWLRRLIGIASIAKQQFDEPKRRSYASTMMRWRTNSTRIPSKIENLDSDKMGRGKEGGESQLKFIDLKGKEHTVPADNCSTWQDLVQFLESNGIATAPYIILGPENKAVPRKSWKALLKVVRKGHLKTIFKIAEGDYPPSPPATMSHFKSSFPGPSIKETTGQQIPPDMGNVIKHVTRTLEGPASLAEAILAEPAESITHADSPESIIYAKSAESIIYAKSAESIILAESVESIIRADSPESITPATVSHSNSSSPEPSIKEMTDQQIPPDMGSVTKHAIRTLEGSASLTEAILAESVKSITHADSPEPNRDISLDLILQGNTTRNTTERDVNFSIRGSINPTNQNAPVQTKDSWNGKERPALTWMEDGVRGESSTNESRVRVPEASPPPIRIQYRRPTVEDYSHDDSSSSNLSSSSRSRRENRNGDSRSPSISRRRPRTQYIRTAGYRRRSPPSYESGSSSNPSIPRRRRSPPRYRSESSSSSSPSIPRSRYTSPLFRRRNRSSGSSNPSIRRLRRRFSLSRLRRENRNGNSRSPSPRRRSSSPWVLRENRNDDSRSSSPRRRFSPRFRIENRKGDSRSPSLRRENSFDSERNWRDKQTRAYASIETPRYRPDPPQLTFYWASQIDIELGCWATPWQRGMDALDMMVDIGLAGLSQTARLAQPKANRPAVDSNEIIYAEFPGPVILGDLWIHLREGEHTWPPYAINARGGVRGLATHSLVQHSAFRDDERLPQLTLLNSVHKAGMSTAETSTASQVLERDRILELASIDFWLSHAAATSSISKGKSNLVINTPAIVEEIWLKFFQEIMATRKELWNPGGGDMPIRKLANYISDFLSDFLGSPAEIYFVWVAFLRAVKVMECVANGPQTFPALHIFENDILVYLV